MNKIKKIAASSLVIVLIIGSYVCNLIRHSDKYIRNRIVKIEGFKGGMCSGEQIHAPNGVDYVLTAAHCRELGHDDIFTIIRENGEKIERKLIAEDPNSDLLLIQGVPNLYGLDIADYSSPKQHVFTLTHGNNYPTYRTDGVIIGNDIIKVPLYPIEDKKQELLCGLMVKNHIENIDTFFGPITACVLDIEETITTALIVPGSSGGAILDDSGKLVGVASATSGAFGYFIGLPAIKLFLKSI